MIVDDALADPGPRTPGPVLRVVGRVLPGVRQVQDQVEPYASAWAASNAATLTGTGPLWVALGDSMTQGVGASAWDLGWVGQLSSRLASGGWTHRVLNLSVAGASVEDLVAGQLAALDAVVASSGPPALVTVVVGSADVVSPLRRRGLADRFAAMLDRLPRRAVVMNLANRHREAGRVHELLRARAAAGSVVLADLRREGPGSWQGLLAADGFHPNDRGHAAMAAVVARALERAGLPSRGPPS